MERRKDESQRVKGRDERRAKGAGLEPSLATVLSPGVCKRHEGSKGRVRGSEGAIQALRAFTKTQSPVFGEPSG